MKRLLPALLLAASAVHAEVNVSEAWVRLLPPTVTTTAAYLQVHSDRPDRLTSVSSSQANRVEVHQSEMKDGHMQMTPVANVELQAGTALVFEPGGLHLMVMGLHSPLKAGDSLPLQLEFEQAGSVVVEAEIRP